MELSSLYTLDANIEELIEANETLLTKARKIRDGINKKVSDFSTKISKEADEIAKDCNKFLNPEKPEVAEDLYIQEKASPIDNDHNEKEEIREKKEEKILKVLQRVIK